MATTWDPAQYLRFAGHRERPFDELVARIPIEAPEQVVDLGCGPGTATARLTARWPGAHVVGVDSSPDMLRRASSLATPGRLEFEHGDFADWTPEHPVDVIVSNALLQWVPDHVERFGALVDAVVPGGVFAFQVPANFDAPLHTELRRLARSGRWDLSTAGLLRDVPVLEPVAYLERLAALDTEPDVWETTYLQVLTGPDAVLEWARGTALRPVRSALPPDEITVFESEYGAALRDAYPPDAQGRTVLPFRRIFAVARRRAG